MPDFLLCKNRYPHLKGEKMKRENELEISINTYPIVLCRTILPTDTKAEKKSKNKKQFINLRTSTLNVKDSGKEYCIIAHKDYCFDGATIPFGIGKGNMKLLIPALFHDIMCDNKAVVNYDRYLSSLVFKRLLLMCGVPKMKANLMYGCVDNYQKLFGNWRKK